MNSKLLITGHLGYIGRHLMQSLDVTPTPVDVCDLKDGDDFQDIKGHEFDCVIHLAAHASVTESLRDPDECLNNNAFKLIPFFQNNKINRFVFASTGGAIYGERRNARENDARWQGCLSPYGQSKFIAEEIIRRMVPNYAILRLGNVFGGDDTGRLETAMHRHFKDDDPIVVYGGNQTRDFVDVNVVVEAFLRAASRDVVGTFNIGSGEERRVSHIAASYSASRNVKIVYKDARPGEVQNVSLNVDKAREAGLL